MELHGGEYLLCGSMREATWGSVCMVLYLNLRALPYTIFDMDDKLTSTHDPHNATITVRLIRSFEYRTIRNHVFRNIDLTKWTPRRLIAEVKALVAVAPGFTPYRTIEFDAVKIYTHAHLTKTQNLSINLDNDEWVLSVPEKLDTPLNDIGVMNESELSVFNYNAYAGFRENPVQKWE